MDWVCFCPGVICSTNKPFVLKFKVKCEVFWVPFPWWKNWKPSRLSLMCFFAQDVANLFIHENCPEFCALAVSTAEHLPRPLSKISVEFFHILKTKSSSVSGLLSLHCGFLFVLLHLCFLSPIQTFPNSQSSTWTLFQDRQQSPGRAQPVFGVVGWWLAFVLCLALQNSDPQAKFSLQMSSLQKYP